jgi:putative membrane protein
MNEPSHSISYYLIYWLISALAFLLTSKIVKGFEVNGIFSAFFAAMALGFANTFIWPILIFLTLPLNIITLGLFTFVVNGAVLKLVAAFLPGFKIHGWFSAIIGAILLAILNAILHYFLMPTFASPTPTVSI